MGRQKTYNIYEVLVAHKEASTFRYCEDAADHLFRKAHIYTACTDALLVDKLVDKFVAGHRVKLLNSLNQILQQSPGTQILAPRDGTFKMKAGSIFLED